jgi:hypothetical protein
LVSTVLTFFVGTNAAAVPYGAGSGPQRSRRAQTPDMHSHNDEIRYDLVLPSAGPQRSVAATYRAVCTCGEWEHDRLVNPENPRDKAEAQVAWNEHHMLAGE